MDGDSHLRLGIWRKARRKIGGVLALACLLPLGSCAVAVPPEQVTYVEPRRVVSVEPLSEASPRRGRLGGERWL